ncbi:MAG: alpha/beta hydrolase [Chloroflexota bacterium]|nr:alpha/beta hydrolase [Chloroflexota bacterium]MDE2941977.1 alpha/beta hydrolase [Chloroflexota bacterium]MDE3267075.1 alpha/beta hydrolase [Chloroflexota bacterium]
MSSKVVRSDPQSLWLKSGDLNIHYQDWGGTRQPLVALHGAASSSHWYDLVIPHLDGDIRVVAPDQRAHGKTDQPSTGYDWRTLAGDVVGALDQLGIEKAAVMGHSWGASTALAVAAYHPDRTQGLIMVDGGFGGRRSPEMTWEEFRDRLSPRDIYGPRERYLGALRQQFEHCWSDKLEQMVMSMVRVDPDGSVHERLELSNQQQMLWAMWSEPTSDLMPLVKCPTLMVAAAGRRPVANPEMLERRRANVEAAQAAMPNARVAWIQDTGHDIGYEKPEELAAVIGEFLTTI